MNFFHPQISVADKIIFHSASASITSSFLSFGLNDANGIVQTKVRIYGLGVDSTNSTCWNLQYLRRELFEQWMKSIGEILLRGDSWTLESTREHSETFIWKDRWWLFIELFGEFIEIMGIQTWVVVKEGSLIDIDLLLSWLEFHVKKLLSRVDVK
jgi:hypothetical protein